MQHTTEAQKRHLEKQNPVISWPIDTKKRKRNKMLSLDYAIKTDKIKKKSHGNEIIQKIKVRSKNMKK